MTRTGRVFVVALMGCVLLGAAGGALTWWLAHPTCCGGIC